MVALKTIFWLCLALVVYTYVGYGALLWLLVRLKRLLRAGKPDPTATEQTDDTALPQLTLMICAWNEEAVIREKMENIRQLDYPSDKLTVMWVTDGSDDGSNQLLQQYPEVTLVFSPERRGKAAAMQHGLRENTAPFVVFTDANTMLNSGAMREIARLFRDPTVGCVAGEKRVVARQQAGTDTEAARGEGLYWRYESTLKRWDSELYSAMGAAGELFAVRMSCYRPAPGNALLDDFMISMLIVRQGYKIAYSADAYAVENGSANMAEESKRKRRIAAGGLQSSWWLRGMMNPLSGWRGGLHATLRSATTAFQLVSHRVLRWTITPVALVVLVPVNVVLVIQNAGWIYTAAWIAQLLFYMAALIGKPRAIRYFLFMNLNVFRGVAYLFTHSKSGTWEKSKRA